MSIMVRAVCPDIDGAIVHHARALYNLVFGDSRLFNDIGCDGTARMAQERKANGSDSTQTSTNSKVAADKQRYTLFPNPNDGNITLVQKLQDIKPVQAEVWNATGEVVHKGPLQFAGGTTQLKVMNAVPGMYVLQLTDSDGNQYVLKFVISEK